MAKPVKISIITRTKNRPVLLARAAQSLSEQHFDDFEWVIINDGGDEAEVAAIVKSCPAGTAQSIITLAPPHGRGGAAAKGLESARGDYVMLHDDDDRLTPDALRKLSAALDADENAMAVSCAFIRIDETFEGGALKEKGRKTSAAPALPVSLSDLAYRNQILTIGTLFRRKAALAVGGVNPELPVLEDWDLWLRMAEQGDILRLPEVLAYQHVRAGSGDQASSDLALHRQVEARLRNAYLRKDLAEGRQGLGHLMNMQHRETLEEMKGFLGRLRAIKSALFFWRS